MIAETVSLGQVLAPLASGTSVVLLYHYLGKEYLGADENAQWNALRRTLLSASDSIVRQKTDFAVTNPAHNAEKVATLNKEVRSQEVAQALEDQGYAQGVLSGLKYRPENADPNGDNTTYELGSMVYRESKSDLLSDALALRQVHAFWFENENGCIEVYAHEEYSSLNPAVAWMHYTAHTQDYEKGIKRVKGDLRASGLLE